MGFFLSRTDTLHDRPVFDIHNLRIFFSHHVVHKHMKFKPFKTCYTLIAIILIIFGFGTTECFVPRDPFKQLKESIYYVHIHGIKRRTNEGQLLRDEVVLNV